MKKVVIVGGVAVGASTAARLRRLDEEIEIVLFEKGDYISFANCGLPYYIGDVISERQKLLVATPKLLRERFKIDVRTNSEVTQVDPTGQTVTIHHPSQGTYQESYDYLVLAPGAKPIVPPIPGVTSDRIYTLRNVADTDRIKASLDGVHTATVVGGGYIGVEMAENLRHSGITVNLIEAAPHILSPFDEDMVVLAEEVLRANGVTLHLADKVTAFVPTASGIETTLASGKTLASDVVILAIGVQPDTGFLQGTDIQLGSTGHILTNDALQTNYPTIYAGGDAILVTDFVNGNQTAIPLAGPANKQGRIIADRIAGLATTYKNTQGSTVIKVFDTTLAATGNNERTLDRLGIAHEVVLLHPNDHAAYYPNPTPISLKLIFNQEGAILGAQAFGQKGVEKRIDVLATALRLGGTVYDLTELELCYAPPYSSAKDPVNFAGYIAENVLTGKTALVHPREIAQLPVDGPIRLLDVRTDAEYARAHLSGALHIPLDSLRDRLAELDPDTEYWVFCAVGLRAHTAVRILNQHGYQCKNITGGWKTMQAMGLIDRI